MPRMKPVSTFPWWEGQGAMQYRIVPTAAPFSPAVPRRAGGERLGPGAGSMEVLAGRGPATAASDIRHIGGCP